MRLLPEGEPVRNKAVLPSNRSLEYALDKQKTWELAASLGIRVPSSVVLARGGQVAPPGGFPVVLKPLHSKLIIQGSLQTIEVGIARDDAERMRWLDRWLPHTAVQQQQYVSGLGVGVEFLYAGGRKLWHLVHERVHESPLTGGASTYRRSIAPDDRTIATAQRLMDALAWHGVAMVEFKRDENGELWLMEINPRLWGSLAVAIDAGVDFPGGLLRLATGQDPGRQPRYRYPYYTRDLRSDVDWMKANLRADHRDPLLLTRPRLRSALEYLRPVIGKESWDHFDIHDLGLSVWLVRQTLSDQTRVVSNKLRSRRLDRRVRQHHREVLGQLKACRDDVRSVLFLCYGNMCRSPLAELLCKRRLPALTVASQAWAAVSCLSARRTSWRLEHLWACP